MAGDAGRLAMLYISKVDEVLNGLTQKDERASKVVEEASRYLCDSRFYFDKKSYLAALAAASYAEGLLDSLRLLGLTEFKWPEESEPR